MFRMNRLHASCENNLPKMLKADIQDFQNKVEGKGYLLRRIPTIDIYPSDKEKV